MNLAKWCQKHSVRPGRSQDAYLRVYFKDGREPWMVRVTAIGEATIVVRRRPGAHESLIRNSEVERLEWLRADDLLNYGIIDVPGLIAVSKL